MCFLPHPFRCSVYFSMRRRRNNFGWNQRKCLDNSVVVVSLDLDCKGCGSRIRSCLLCWFGATFRFVCCKCQLLNVQFDANLHQHKMIKNKNLDYLNGIKIKRYRKYQSKCQCDYNSLRINIMDLQGIMWWRLKEGKPFSVQLCI